MVIYEGKPSGNSFEPAIEASFTVKYGDIPRGFPASEMKCAYYDEIADIWRTYETTDVIDNAEEKTYTVKCLIDHFSIIAVVSCGTEEKKIMTVDLNTAFANPIEPATKQEDGLYEARDDTSKYWFNNAVDKGGDSSNQGIHLIPEIIQGIQGYKFSCNIQTANPTADRQVDLYSGDEEGDPIEPNAEVADSCSIYFQDWDDDDSPEKGADGLSYAFVDEGWNALSISNADSLKDECYKACSEKAKADVQNEFDMSDEKSKEMITGDGINDYVVTLFCTASKTDSACTGNCTYDAASVACKVDEKYNEGHPFNNLIATYTEKGISTMEYPLPVSTNPSRLFSFYATPKTYGYARTKGVENLFSGIVYWGGYSDTSKIQSKSEEIVLGGYSEFTIDIQENGAACVNSDGLDSTEVKLIKVDSDSEAEAAQEMQANGNTAATVPNGQTVQQQTGTQQGEIRYRHSRLELNWARFPPRREQTQ
jgi:hypothetical protein